MNSTYEQKIQASFPAQRRMTQQDTTTVKKRMNDTSTQQGIDSGNDNGCDFFDNDFAGLSRCWRVDGMGMGRVDG